MAVTTVTMSVSCICGSVMIQGVIQQREPKCANINCANKSAKNNNGSCYYCPSGAGSAGQHPQGFFYCISCAIAVSQNGAFQQQIQTIEMTSGNAESLNHPITVEMMKQQNDKSYFGKLLDIECIREHFDVEFETVSTFQMFKAMVIIYIFSVFDIITDILFALKISSLMGDDCAKRLISVGAIDFSFEATVFFLWFSTFCAILYTVYCKYYCSYKAMKQFQITYWNALKYVAATTQFRLDMIHSNCWNKYQFSRLGIVCLEDLIQLVIGYLFIFSVYVDAIVLLSTFLSTLAVVYTIFYALYRLFRDITRKIFLCCCIRHNVCNCKCIKSCCGCVDTACYWFVIAVALIWTLINLMMLVVDREANVYVDYGFMYAEAEFNITDLDVTYSYLGYDMIYKQGSLYTEYHDNYTFSEYDVDHHSIDTKIYGHATNAKWCFDMDLFDVSEFVEMNLDGFSGEDITNENEVNFLFPIICLRVVEKHLRIYFCDGTYVQYFVTNNALDFSGNANTVNYPNDFMQSMDCTDCDFALDMNLVASWNIDYMFMNMVDCEAI